MTERSSMISTVQRQDRSNYVHHIIKKFRELFPDEFEKCDIKECGHCRATGFKDNQVEQLCDNCGGMGFVGFKKLYGEFICRSCNGYGCSKCNYKGTVDWIAHANGSDIYKGKGW